MNSWLSLSDSLNRIVQYGTNSGFAQVGQDLFVLSLFDRPGVYIELGASYPIINSNTYILEKHGWIGSSFDLNPRIEEWVKAGRWAAPIRADATTLDWGQYPHREIDYLSLDVEEDNLRAVEHLPLDRMQFNVATIEHNAYMDGGKTRDAIRNIMLAAGYFIARPDVAAEGLEFEDWWIHETIVPKFKELEDVSA